MSNFESLGDGNCLYNTEAALIVYAHLSGLLTPLWKRKDFVQNIGMLLEKTQKTNPNEIKLPSLKKTHTVESVKKALDELLALLSTKNKINWVKLQLIIAKGLRAQLVQTIEQDKFVKQEAIKQLSFAIDSTLLMYCKEGEEALPTEDEFFTSYHFEDMSEIREKMLEVIYDDKLKTLDQKKSALRKWFFEGQQEGLTLYLYGENGIKANAVHAGELEVMILSHLFHHRALYKAGDSQTREINGFDSKRKTDLVFTVKKMIAHWEAVLPESALSNEIIKVYKPQRRQHVREIEKQENAQLLVEIQCEYGSFAQHHETNLSDYTKTEYCKMHKITQKQYKDNTLPKAAALLLARQQETNENQENNEAEETAKSSEQSATSLASKNIQTKPTASSSQKSENKVKTTSSPQKSINNVQTASSPQRNVKNTQTASQSRGDENTVLNRNWMNYGSMLLALFAGIALFSHCFILPIIIPVMDIFFVGLSLSHNFCWISSGITTLLSLGLGVVFTEQIHTAGETAQRNERASQQGQREVSNRSVATEHQTSTEKPSQLLLTQYQNQTMQSKNKVEATKKVEVTKDIAIKTASKPRHP